MKSFKEFLNESSLSRIKSKSDKGGIATMSASRADKSSTNYSYSHRNSQFNLIVHFARVSVLFILLPLLIYPPCIHIS